MSAAAPATPEGEVVAWAVAHHYRDRSAYVGVGDFSVYVGRGARGRGYGRTAVEALIEECEQRGLWKLVSRIFPENEASLALCRSLGFREVGVYRRHVRALFAPPACSRTDVLRGAATLAVDNTLQSAMLFANAKLLPRLRATTFDEVLAVGVGPEGELDG